jgi:anti-sigma regulatory factor (Ser/Thr protein kinase)
MKALSLIWLLSLLASLTTAQQNTVDSLKRELEATTFMGFATYYLKKGNYALALRNIQQAVQNHKAYDPRPGTLLMDYWILSELYLKTGAIDSSIFYTTRAYEIARQIHSPGHMYGISSVMANLYKLKNNNDSLLKYLETSFALKDSLYNPEKIVQYFNLVFDEQLQREKQVQQMQLQRQSLLKNILIAGIIVLLLIAAIIFRNITLRRRNEKMRLQHELKVQKLESEKQLSELEMQALRAQMNPHFIFNSLNAINRFILQKNSAQASEYLTKFSRLMRLILQNSQASLISLESELEALELYLSLEVLRFDYHFSYKVLIADDVDASELKVPPLIIQPYVENAIWHGLMHKEEKGQLDIEVSQEDNFLCVKVIDNGIGRKKAAEVASKSATRHKSMGLKITADRIAMMRHENSNESVIKINDLVDPDGSAAGTEVIIKIPIVQ